MASTLEQLVVELVADVRGYHAELQKSQQQTRDWSEGVQRQTAGVKRAFAALGLGAVAAGIASITREALASAEQTQRMALSLGSNVETVQELSFAFREFGADTDDVADALNTLADRSEDALSGTKSFIDDFRLLGVEVEQLRGLRPEQIFALVAEQVSKIEDPTQRAAGVVRIFGDDLGRRLLPLLIEGSDGLARLRQEAHELGVVLDEDAVGKMVDANREFRQMRNLIDAQLARAVSDNAENLTSLAEAIGAVARAAIVGGGAVASFVQWVGEELAVAIHGVADDDVPRLIGRLGDAREELERLQALNARGLLAEDRLRSPDQQIAEQQALVESLERRVELAERLNRQEREASRGQSDSPPEDLPGGPGGGGIGPDPDDAELKLKRAAALHTQSLIDAEDKEIEQNRKIVDLQEERFRRIHEMALESTDQLVALEEYRFREQQRQLDEEEQRLRERNLLSLDLESQFQQAREELAQGHAARLEEIRERMAEEGDPFAQLSVYADQAARNIQDAFADFLFDPFADGVDGMLQSFVDTLRRMAAEAAASQIFGLLGEVGGNPVLDAIGNFFGGRRAAGGSVEPNRAYVVGERGPELLVPGMSGTVIPNHALGGGGNVYVNIEHVGPGQPAIDVSEQMAGLDRMINVRIEQGIANAIGTGKLDRMMGSAYGVGRRPVR